MIATSRLHRALVIGMTVGALALSPGLVLAQDTQPPTAGPAEVTTPQTADVVALEARVAQLETLVAALSKRVDDVDEAAKKPIKAPFTVVDDNGGIIFGVRADGGGADLELAGSAGSISLKTGATVGIRVEAGSKKASLTADSDGPHVRLEEDGASLSAGASGGVADLLLSQGENNVSLRAETDRALLLVTEGGNDASVGLAGTAFGFGVRIGGSRIATLGDPGDGNYSVRIYKPGSQLPILQAGVLKAGNPGLTVGDGANDFVRLEGDDNQGVVRTYKANSEVTTLGNVDGETGLQVHDADQILEATVGGGDGPQYALVKSGTLFFQVHSTDDNPSLILAKDSEKIWLMRAGDVSLIGKGGDSRIELTGLGSPNLTATEDGKPRAIFGSQAGGFLTLNGDADLPLVAISARNSAPTVRLRSISGNDLASLTGKGDQGQLDISDATGIVATMGSKDGSGTLSVLTGGKPTASLGPVANRPAAIRAYDTSGTQVVAAGAVGTGSGILAMYGGDKLAVSIESREDSTGGVTVFAGGKISASMNTIDKIGAGLVEIRNQSGAAVAFLGLSDAGFGGNVTATDPSGNGVFSAGYDGGDGPGSACVEHKGTKCLGVGLTGIEGMH